MNTITKTLVILVLAAAVAATLALKQRPVNAPSDEPLAANNTASEGVPSSPTVAALPRLVDLGADQCVPCKMMAPVLAALKTDFAGKLDVEFIDVWKNPDAGATYGIDIIPTQIFYSASGEELRRHTGFIGREDILATWKTLGVDLDQLALPMP